MSERGAQPQFPIRLGSAAEFARVRKFLTESNYDADHISRALPTTETGKFDRARWDEIKAKDVPARLHLVIDVLFRGVGISEREFRAVCDAETLEAFRTLGLLQAGTARAGELVCPVWAYPVENFFITSDRFGYIENGVAGAASDVIYSGLNELTAQFLRMLPDARGGDVLDLCGGSGIGALLLSRTARSAASSDITERSAFFAEFNARLNDVAISSLCGDMYEPVSGRQFDLITAHPPFVVAADGVRLVYRDAGEFGEAITRRIVQGLPAHLREGGRCVIVCAAWDREQPLERRIHEWLGGSAKMFDVAFALCSAASVDTACMEMGTLCADLGVEGVQKLARDLKQWGARERVYGVLAIERCAEPVTVPPLRIQLVGDGDGKDLQRLMDWRGRRRQPGFAQAIAGAKPKPAAHVVLTTKQTVQSGVLAPSEYIFQATDTFGTALALDKWIGPWVTKFDGTLTVASLLAEAHAGNALPQEFTLEHFADLVGLMAERSMLEIDWPAENAETAPRQVTLTA